MALNVTRRLSFVEMTDSEVKLYATRLAQRASRTIRIEECCRRREMTEEEEAQYAQAISDSILYFNKRDPNHAAAMRYRSEMQEMENRKRDRMEELRQKQKMDVVIL